MSHVARALFLAGTIMLLAAAPAAGSAVVTVTLTTANLHRALTPMPSIRFGPPRPRVRTIRVDDRVRYQRVLGFGAAMTDSSAWLLWDELPAATRNRTIAALARVDNEVRVPMGASDFTVSGVPYSYDDMPAGQTDPTLAHFSIQHDRAYILPALRLLLRDNPAAQVIAAPWSLPGWMKTNDTLDNVDFAGTLIPADYWTAAEYFVRFLQAYAAAGVPIAAITPENEAGTDSQYPGMNLDEAGFIVNDLVPALRGAGLNTPVYALDGSGFAAGEQLLEDPAVRAAIAGIAWHCYVGLQQMSWLHQLDPRAGLIMDECSPGPPKFDPYVTSEAVIDSLDNWAQTVQLWNLALNPVGGPRQLVPGCFHCRALVTVNERRHTARLTLYYYQLAQAAVFVRRGAQRIFATRLVSEWTDVATDGHGLTAGVDDVALRNPGGQIVLVAYNNSTRLARFQVRWRGRAFVYRLPAAATVTFTWR